MSLGKQLALALLLLALVPGTVVSLLALRQVIQVNQLWESAGMEEALASSVTVAKQSLRRMEVDLALASGPLVERWRDRAPNFNTDTSERLFVSRFLDDLDLAFVQVYVPDSTGDFHLESAVYRKDVRPVVLDEEIDRWRPGSGALQSTTGAFARVEELGDKRRVAIGYILEHDFFGRLSELQLGLGTYRALAVYARVFRTYLLVLMAAILIAVAGLSVWAAWFLAGRLAGPVTNLAGQIKGDPQSVRFQKPPHATSEVVDLANALNRLTEELRAKQLELMRAERVAGSALVAKHVAHEIKNALATIGYSLWPLEESVRSAPAAEAAPRQESLQAVHVQLASLEEMAETFSQLGRMAEPIPDQIVDLNQLVRATRALYSTGPSEIRLELESGPLPILGDEHALRRVISNLVKNAIEAPSRDEIVLKTARQGALAMVEILDSGPGIPPEIQGRIFEPGFSTKGRGSGLGLFMVRAIVDRHHGAISVESRSGGGTTVRITFPLEASDTRGQT